MDSLGRILVLFFLTSLLLHECRADGLGFFWGFPTNVSAPQIVACTFGIPNTGASCSPVRPNDTTRVHLHKDSPHSPEFLHNECRSPAILHDGVCGRWHDDRFAHWRRSRPTIVAGPESERYATSRTALSFSIYSRHEHRRLQAGPDRGRLCEQYRWI